jgi:hypothetical protein
VDAGPTSADPSGLVGTYRGRGGSIAASATQPSVTGPVALQTVGKQRASQRPLLYLCVRRACPQQWRQRRGTCPMSVPTGKAPTGFAKADRADRDAGVDRNDTGRRMRPTAGADGSPPAGRLWSDPHPPPLPASVAVVPSRSTGRR